MPALSENNNHSTRSRLLDVAAAHFAMHGIEGATMRKIAEGAGIQAPSIFHHFPGGKSELYDQLLGEMMLEIGQVIQQAIEQDRAPVESVLVLFEALWDMYQHQPEYAALIVREMMFPDALRQERFKVQTDMMLTVMHDFFESSQQRGELRQFSVDCCTQVRRG